MSWLPDLPAASAPSRDEIPAPRGLPLPSPPTGPVLPAWTGREGDWDLIMQVVTDRLASAAIPLADTLIDPYIDEYGRLREMPPAAHIWYRIRHYDQYKDLYRESRAFQSHVLLDAGIAAAMDSSNDFIEEEYEPGRAPGPSRRRLANPAAVARSRLVLDMVHKTVPLLNPQEFNLEKKVSHSGSVTIAAIADKLQGDGVEDLEAIRPPALEDKT
jgi:hypothetical protein